MSLTGWRTAGGGRRQQPSPSAAPEINKPEIVAEVRAVFEAYEAALMANDAGPLDASFWEDAVRFGVVDIEYGAEEIARWRAASPPLPEGRRTGPTVVSTFGDDFACVSTEFRYPGSDKVGRQQQTWVRFAEGWRIVGAHVSQIPAEAIGA